MDGPQYFAAPDGCRIAYRDLGPKDAPAIVFCTMATAAMSVWSPVLEPLSRTHRVIIHDRRGNGDSDPGAPETHRFEVFRGDVLGVMDVAGVDRATICGMAFGARVALRVALDAPMRTSALLLFDATGGPPAPESVRRAGSQEALRIRPARASTARPCVASRSGSRDSIQSGSRPSSPAANRTRISTAHAGSRARSAAPGWSHCR